MDDFVPLDRKLLRVGGINLDVYTSGALYLTVDKVLKPVIFDQLTYMEGILASEHLVSRTNGEAIP